MQLDPGSPGRSQPMTTSNSGSGDVPVQDGSGDASSSYSPYGTRSRNHRTGNSRPNYAEDKEMDFEFDYHPSKKDPAPKRSNRQNQTSASSGSEAQRATGSSRRSTADDSKIGISQQGAKDENLASQPASSHAGNGTGGSQLASKKRKAAANSANSTPAPQTSQPGVTPSTRSASQTQTPNLGIASSETNMLTFEDCNAMPKDGKLVADDGTVLAPNGTLRITAPHPPCYPPPSAQFNQTRRGPRC